MTHPIIDLQTAMVSKLAGDIVLTSLIGADAIFDLPPKGKQGAYLIIARHDILTRDGDTTPGNDHRIQLRAWTPEADRAAVLTIAEQVVEVLSNEELGSANLVVTNVHHQRTDSAIDKKTGRAHATISLRIFSEPTA